MNKTTSDTARTHATPPQRRGHLDRPSELQLRELTQLLLSALDHPGAGRSAPRAASPPSVGAGALQSAAVHTPHMQMSSGVGTAAVARLESPSRPPTAESPNYRPSAATRRCSAGFPTAGPPPLSAPVPPRLVRTRAESPLPVNERTAHQDSGGQTRASRSWRGHRETVPQTGARGVRFCRREPLRSGWREMSVRNQLEMIYFSVGPRSKNGAACGGRLCSAGGGD